MVWSTEDTRGGAFLIEPVTQREPFTREDFGPDEEHFAAIADAFIEKEVLPRIDAIEAQEPGLMPRLLKRAGELGLLMLEIPVEYGGLGVSKSAALLVAARGSVCGSFSVSWTAHTGIGSLPLVLYGTDEQRAHYLPRLATGELLAAYALSEPSSGSDALGAKTKALLSADGTMYRLNGVKQFITNAGFADLFTVFAKVDGEKFTAFLIERATPGVSVGPEEHKMGIKGSSTCQLILEDVDVPVANVLGTIGAGHKIAFNILNIGRLKLGGIATEGAKGALHEAMRYAVARQQFQTPIVQFGAIQRKIADMAARIYASESMTYRTAGLLDAGCDRLDRGAASYWSDVQKVTEEFAIEQSILKVYGSETLDFCVDETLQMLGGYGYIEEYGFARRYRDSRINRIFEGTNEINRLLIPGTLMKRAMTGALPLLEFIQHVHAELDTTPARDSTALLAAEHTALDGAKRLTAYAAGVLVEREPADLSRKQQHLELFSDMICEVYALDSAIGRTLKLIHQRGADACAAEIDLTRLVAADTSERFTKAARRLLSNDAETAERHLDAMAKLCNYVPVGSLDIKTRVAERIIAQYQPAT
jgi:butyryl-CoA dehydrogenase